MIEQIKAGSGRLDVKGAAEYVGMSVAFLNRHRGTGDGPEYLKTGGRVWYEVADLEAWLASCRRRSTGSATPVVAA